MATRKLEVLLAVSPLHISTPEGSLGWRFGHKGRLGGGYIPAAETSDGRPGYRTLCSDGETIYEVLIAKQRQNGMGSQPRVE